MKKFFRRIKEGIEDDDDNDEKVEAYNISLTEYLHYFEKTYTGCLNKRIQLRVTLLFGRAL